MSRHRMVRNLTEDDYHDDDYDDYYDEEDYEEYDQSYVAPKKETAPPAVPAKQPSTTISAKVAFPAKKSPVTFASAAPAGNSKPPNTSEKSALSSAVGVSKPPPGWGKPLVPSDETGGVSKPPHGWGKPTTRVTVATATISSVDKPEVNVGKNETQEKTPASSPKRNQAAAKQSQQPFKSKPLPKFLQQDSTALPSQLSMVVLGHVDAGKSTMMGQLLIQTGQVSKRQAQRQGQLAWLLDENESERARGVTMEIGTKCISTKNHQIIVLDAPGHADFIPIMITGAANADTCILVVDAVLGEFEAGFSGGGQTKEHILLAKGLGVSQVIVAINKMDVEGWNQDRYDLIQQQVVDYLAQQRFKPARIQCVPVSGLTGENVQSQTEPLLRQWYQGPTLMQAVDRFKPANRQIDKPLRFIVSDMYAEGKGVVVRGRVVQGFVQVGDKVKVLPLSDDALVSRLDHLQLPEDGEQDRLSVGLAGDTVELLLSNVDPLRVGVGNVVVDPTHMPLVAKKAKAKVLIMEELKVPIIRGSQVLFHMHNLDVPANLPHLIATLKPDGSVLKERPRALSSGTSALVEIKLSDHVKIAMERFQDCRALGRFVLRRGGDTIAVGVIEEIIR